MRNYALITTALSALLLGLSFSGQARAQDALADTLPAPASATAPAAAPATPPATATTLPTGSATAPVLTPAPGAGVTTSTTTTTTTGTVPPTTASSSSVIVPVTSTTSTLPVGSALSGATKDGLTTSPAMPTAVQDAMTRLQKVDQINLDDMIRAQDAINRLDLLLEIEKRQTELKKVRDERNKPAASATAAAAAGLLGSAIPAAALNLPKITVPDAPSSSSSSSGSSSPSFTPPKPKSSEGPSEKLSIKRISGTDGRYFAVINTDDNSSQTVHVGDKLPDGTLVKAITLTSVSLFKDKKSKNLTIPSDSYIVRESGNSLQ